MTLDELKTYCQPRINVIFDAYLKTSSPSPLLTESLIYTVYNEGKRIRSLLTYLCGYIFDAPWENTDLPAAAIELIHTYSLIHDDLPSMDNADVRRGKPSCHKKYGDGIAILTGDALQPLAFEILASYPAEQLNSQQRLTMIKLLSQAIGFQGMVGGQALDILGTESFSELTKMYQLKTSNLLTTAALLGLIAANEENNTTFNHFIDFTTCLGLAFQIQDDLLDIEGNPITTGKPQGIDEANKKTTYVDYIGITSAKQKIIELYEAAYAAIAFLGEKKQILQEFTHSILLY